MNMINSIKEIDVYFDFTTDSPGYWDNFWENKNGLGAGNSDPDASSKTLQQYHKLLYPRKLPNGDYMELSTGPATIYLRWKEFRFGSDSITASFRYKDYKDMIDNVKRSLPNYKKYMEIFLRKTYTIGGNIIFPKRINSINQKRGCNPKIRDRWDLTLECIKRFYNNEYSPLYDDLEKDRDFFNLFKDFKGYIDYFFLNDCVTDNNKMVIFWTDLVPFVDEPLPRNVPEYIKFIENEIDFVNKRNNRIKEYIESC